MLKDLKDRAAAIACDFSAEDVEIGTAVREIMRLVQDAVDAERKERLREFGTDGREMPADACHVKNADTRLQVETSLSHIFGEIARRRESQDFKWGGPAHDDTHKLPEWVAFAHTYLCRAQIAGWNTRLTGDYDASLDFEKQMIHVAALAVASIQSSRRKRNG